MQTYAMRQLQIRNTLVGNLCKKKEYGSNKHFNHIYMILWIKVVLNKFHWEIKRVKILLVHMKTNLIDHDLIDLKL